MRLIYNEKIPILIGGLFEPLGALFEKRERADNALIHLEGILALACLLLFAPLFIHDRKHLIKTAVHLRQPLILQCLGNHDEHSVGTTQRS